MNGLLYNTTSLQVTILFLDISYGFISPRAVLESLVKGIQSWNGSACGYSMGPALTGAGRGWQKYMFPEAWYEYLRSRGSDNCGVLGYSLL
jgi:hypothetical protein